ncbi:MAG: chemotaxis-specific protein-glutamate methyltransferase CheB [Phormidesmis sp.]
MLNIAIVNDTVIAVEALRRAIALTPEYQLLWVAYTGIEAVQRCAVQRPDLILMDLNMPALSGAEATRQIMQRSPCAILIVTASITRNTAQVFEAMGHGALDVVTTPALGTGEPEAVQTLLRKIEIVARLAYSARRSSLNASKLNSAELNSPKLNSANLQKANLQKTNLQKASLRKTNLQSANLQNKEIALSPQKRPSSSPQRLPNLIIIGTSTGGPNALQHILSQLPQAFHAAIVVIQHIDAQFAPGLVDWLNQSSQLPVTLARNGDRPQAGHVLMAGTNDHLMMRTNQTLRYIHEPANSPHRPSVDVFFKSVARHWPQPGIALLLTGMGRDGAGGLALLKSTKWHTVAESAESCVVFGMPKAAIEQGAAGQILPLSQMASYLAQI